MIRVENLSQLQHKLRVLPDYVQEEVAEEIQATGVRIRDNARRRVRDSEVRPTIKKRQLAKGLDARVGTRHWRAKFEEFGTKSHTIKERRAPILAGPEFGPVRGPVRHPGQDPHPFLQPAAEEERRGFVVRISLRLTEAARKVSR